MKKLFPILLLLAIGCGDDPAPQNVKTRVPTVPESSKIAEDAASQAKASLAAAQQIQKDLQKQLDDMKKQPASGYTGSPGGGLEYTAFGRITDVVENWNGQSDGDGYIAFTFVEDGGFTKRFFPLCNGNTLVTGKTQMLYHWGAGNHVGKGCFAIDGFNSK